MEIKQLQEKYKLPDVEHKKIYQQIKENIINLQSSQNSVCNLIIGQSGAGKTTYSHMLHEKDPSLVEIDEDYICSFHPSSSFLFHNYPRDYYFILANDFVLWRERLIQDLIHNKYYFNFETSMKEPNNIFQTINSLQSHDYQFHINILAISYMESRLRILERFFSRFSLTGTGRIIDSFYQKKSIQNIKAGINSFSYPELLSLKFLDYQFAPHYVHPNDNNLAIYESIINESNIYLKNNFHERLDRILQMYFMYREKIEPNLGKRLDEQIKEVLDYFNYPIDIKKRIREF